MITTELSGHDVSRGNLWDTVGYRETRETLPPAVLYVSFPKPFISRFMHYLPLLDHGAVLVPGQVHAVEVGEAVAATHVLNHEAELAEGHLIVLQVSERHLKHTSLQAI